jgi:hypothetical protein
MHAYLFCDQLYRLNSASSRVVRDAGNAVNAVDDVVLMSVAILPLAAELAPSDGRQAPPFRPNRASSWTVH